MTRNGLRFSLLLIAIVGTLSLALQGSRSYAEFEALPTSVPAPTPPPKSPGSGATTAPPWYDDDAIAEASKKLNEEKEKLTIAITSVIEEAKANQIGEEELLKAALPKLGELEKALAQEKVTEGEIQAHDGRCHAGQLAKPAYDACLGEHEQVWSKYEGQVAARQSLAREIIPLQTKLKEMEAKDKEYERQFNQAQARKKEIEKQLVQLAELKETIDSCEPLYRECLKKNTNCPPGIEQGLKYCYSKIWDSAAPGLPKLSGNPQLPFAASENSGSGDGSVVDTRGVQKMTDEERQKELAKPRVQPPKGSGGTPSAPPKP